MAKKDEELPAQEPPSGEAADINAPSPIEELVTENRTKLMVGILAVTVTISAIFILTFLSKQKQDRAAQAFTSAKTVEEFKEVAGQHPGTTAAGDALLRIAELQSKEDKTDDALQTLQDFVGDFAAHPRHAQGIFGIAALHHKGGKLDEAERSFGDLLSQHPDSDLAPLVQMRLGDIAWSRGDLEKAGAIYRRIAPEYPANPYIDDATERLRLLELDPPTEPSERQKKLKEEEDQKRKEREAAAKKAAEEARMKAEEATKKAAETTPAPAESPATPVEKTTPPIEIKPEIPTDTVEPLIPEVPEAEVTPTIPSTTPEAPPAPLEPTTPEPNPIVPLIPLPELPE